MTKPKAHAPAQDAIEQDFLDAIERLLAGEPKNKQLKLRRAKGTLKINFSSVAMEAGRARTLIALVDGCRYPRIRELVKQSSASISSVPTTQSELIARLRLDKTDLQEQVNKYKAEALLHFSARLKAENEAARDREIAARLRKEISQHGKPFTVLSRES